MTLSTIDRKKTTQSLMGFVMLVMCSCGSARDVSFPRIYDDPEEERMALEFLVGGLGQIPYEAQELGELRWAFWSGLNLSPDEAHKAVPLARLAAAQINEERVSQVLKQFSGLRMQLGQSRAAHAAVERGVRIYKRAFELCAEKSGAIEQGKSVSAEEAHQFILEREPDFDDSILPFAD